MTLLASASGPSKWKETLWTSSPALGNNHTQKSNVVLFICQLHCLWCDVIMLHQSRCWSFVGRRGGGQVVSLMRNGCVFHQIVQHELLHALGFNHEQTRSDRDSHVRILLENVIPGEPPYTLLVRVCSIKDGIRIFLLNLSKYIIQRNHRVIFPAYRTGT